MGQTTLKSLRLLEILNTRPVTTVGALSAETGFPKPTIVRLLDALINGGYVERMERRGGYRLTERVLKLSSGFHFKDRVVAAAVPHLKAFTAKHKWPVTVATFDKDAMIPRYGTMNESPLAYDTANFNVRLRMLHSALGQVYLAFSPSDETEFILSALQDSDELEDAPVKDLKGTRSLLAKVRKQGFATTPEQFGGRAMGIAVPVKGPVRPYGSITLRYFRTAMSVGDALEQYLPPLQEMGAAISDELAKLGSEPHSKTG